jgi:hypothetical protein
MGKYHQRLDRLAKMPLVLRAAYEGFIWGLAYVQAQSVEGDYPTVVVDVPDHDMWARFERPFMPSEFLDVLADLDDEGGILYVRFFVEEGMHFNSLRLELGSTETEKGLPPDWDQRESLTADEIHGRFG